MIIVAFRNGYPRLQSVTADTFLAEYFFGDMVEPCVWYHHEVKAIEENLKLAYSVFHQSWCFKSCFSFHSLEYNKPTNQKKIYTHKQ